MDLFLRQLKKQALITTESNSFSIPTGTFSLHANIQDLGKYFLINVLQNKLTSSILVMIIDTLSQYAVKVREQNNTYLIALLAKHYETLLAQHEIFSPAQVGHLQGELGTLYSSLGNTVKAQELLEKSVNLLKQCDEKNYVSLIQFLTYLGYTYQDLGAYQQAKDVLIIAHQLCLEYLAPQQKPYAFTLVNLGKVYSKLGDYPKAIKYFEKGIAFYRNDQDHQNVAWTSIYLANIYRRLGKYQKAKNLLEEGLDLYQKYFPGCHANIALTSVHLGQVYRELENDQKAEKLTEQGLRIYQQYFPTNYSKIAWTLAQLGNIYRRLKKYDLAITTLEQSQQLYQEHLPKNRIKRYETLSALAKLYRDSGELQKAQTMLEMSLKVFQEHYGPDHVEAGKLYLELGRILYLQEALTLAEISLENARAILQKAEHPRQYLCLEYLGDIALKYAETTESQYQPQKKQAFQNQAYQYFQQSLVCLEQCELKRSPSFVRLIQKQILSQTSK